MLIKRALISAFATRWPLRTIIRNTLPLSVRARRQALTSQYVETFGCVVSAGPFEGVVLSVESSWGDGDLLPKLSGTYEQALWSAWSEVLGRTYSAAIDVGCAEGYYAVGMTRKLKLDNNVYAFDIDPKARQLCSRNACLNGVKDRLIIGGRCDPNSLREILVENPRSFLLLDCEGGERDLLGSVSLSQLSKCDVLVECHDFLDPGVTNALKTRFEASHNICMILEDVTPIVSHSHFLMRLGSLDRAIGTCEFRPVPMHWLFMKAKDIRQDVDKVAAAHLARCHAE